MKKQHLRLMNITLIGIQGRARIYGQIPIVDNYLFDDVTRGLYTSPVQVSLNLLNVRLIRIGIIKLKNTLTTLNVRVVNCTVSKLSKSPIVDSSAAKTTVIFKKSIVRQVSKGLQVKSKEFTFSMESSKIDNSGRYYPEQDCPQFIVTDKFESLVAHFSKSSFKYAFLIDLAASHQKKSNVSIIDSIFDDDIENLKHNGCFSGITLRNTTALVVNSNFTNIISRKSLIKAIASFITFKECIFSNISSKLSMYSLSSSIIASFNKTNAINNILNGISYGSVYLQSTKGIFEDCTFHNNTVNGRYGNGGAVYIRSSNITVQQCLFKENTVTFSGGAIGMVKTRGIFVNCTFEKNSVESSLQKGGHGGAICALDNSHLTMHQCSFKDNTATGMGGATYIQKSHSLLESCIFERNKVNGLQQNTLGEAIIAFGAGTNVTIKQCLFKENAATYSGGAIATFRLRSLLLKNSTFVRNTVKALKGYGSGGAIVSIRTSDITVQQCLFKENTAPCDCGAINMQKAQGSFVDCTFERNSVKSCLQKSAFGGAICAHDNSHLTMYQSIFKVNTATDSGGATYIQKSHSLFESCIFEKNRVKSLQENTRGGAIAATFAGTNIIIKQCLFKENTATYSGGAIDMEKARGSFVNCTFERNSVKSRLQRSGRGGAICALDNSQLTMHQCIFKENTATYSGGATYIQKSQSLFESCIFERNKVNRLNQDTGGGAISAFGAGTNIIIKQCLFKENTATYSGGAIVMKKLQGSFVNCTFKKNFVKSPLKIVGHGGAISALDNSRLKMHQCIFKENTATYMAGAAYIHKSQSLFESCIFERNKINSLNQGTHAGAISAAGAGTNIIIKQCLFKENTATYAGGAIDMRNIRGSFVNCTFERNSVKGPPKNSGQGGAICAHDNSHLTMHQCIFKENTATYGGGATHIEKSQSLFESCIFERNKMNSQGVGGGAISAFGAVTNITIKQCLFKENAAIYVGGAIIISNSSTLLLKNSTFVRNTVKTVTGTARGGAIASLINSDITVQQCLFKENTATCVGGAIYIQGTQASFKNCTFVGNAVQNLQNTTFGGAISSLDGSVYVMTQCLFKKNTATFYGGACYIQWSQGSFENCTFEGKVWK